jgi:ATP-binding cassette subfamily F protein 3
LIKEIQATAPGMLPGEVRDYLAKFLFTEDDVYKKVAQLSGGERGRLALACLALKGANLLLLDEPTNHLDISSQEILQSMLSSFNGTILLVSHDRFLIDALATQVWYIHRENTQMDLFSGSYSEYRRWQQEHTASNSANTQGITTATERSAPTPEKNKKGTSNRERQRLARIEVLEAGIASAESDLAETTLSMDRAAGDVLRMQTLTEKYIQLEKTIASLMSEWEELSSAE